MAASSVRAVVAESAIDAEAFGGLKAIASVDWPWVTGRDGSSSARELRTGPRQAALNGADRAA